MNPEPTERCEVRSAGLTGATPEPPEPYSRYLGHTFQKVRHLVRPDAACHRGRNWNGRNLWHETRMGFVLPIALSASGRA